MIRFLRKLAKDRRGNMLVIAGAALPLLVGAAGLATDTIQWTLWKRELQRAADSGAIAGVYTRVKDDDQTAVESAVGVDLDKYGGVALIDESTDIELLADDGDRRNQVRVTLEVQKKLPFSSLFMASAPTIRAVSTAASIPGDEYCVIALDPSVAVTGLEIAGSTDLDLGDCSLLANSKHPSKAASNGASSGNGGLGSTVIARSIAAGGGVMYSSTWDVDNYDPNSPQLVDPFGPDGQQPLPNPEPGDCTKTITLDASGTVNRADKDLATDVVCISNGVKGSKDVGVTIAGKLTLGPARYVINGGDLTMNSSGAELNCENCTIVLTKFNDAANTGNFKLTGGTVNITAPTEDGTFKGIALYQDRRAADDGKSGANHINGNSTSEITGVIYTAGRSLLYNGGGNATAACLQVVGRRVTFSGSSKIKVSNECELEGLGAIGGGSRVRLVA